MINKYVIVRDDKAGVFFGILSKKENNELTLTEVRKIYHWSGANTVEDLAMFGVKNPEDCRITVKVPLIVLSNFNQILPCSEESIKSLGNVFVWKK